MNISDKKSLIGFGEFSDIKKPSNNDSFISYSSTMPNNTQDLEEPPLLEELGIDPSKIKNKLF